MVPVGNLKIVLRNKMLSRSYLLYLTKTFGPINKIFGRVKKTIQAKTLVDSSKRVWLTEQKFRRLNQNVLCNQTNTVNQTILLEEPFFFSVSLAQKTLRLETLCARAQKSMRAFVMNTDGNLV